MATRLSRVSPEHVQALNMIDLAFNGGKRRRQSGSEKKITDTWKIYLDHLNSLDADPKNLDAWSAKGDDLFVDLLQRIAEHLAYDFDRVHLRKGIYTPRARGEEELEQYFIRKEFVKIFQGQSAFPMRVTEFPYDEEAAQKQNEANEKLVKYLDEQASQKTD